MDNSNHHPEQPQSFSYSVETLQQIADDVLTLAHKGGADACEMNVSEGSGQNVTVRQGEVETIEYTRDKGLSITVHIGHKRGNASSSDFSPQAIRETVSAALSIARYTADDIYAGLADQDLLATSFPDLDLYHPWSLPVEEAIELARQCEAAALATDKRITNSERQRIGRRLTLRLRQFARILRRLSTVTPQHQLRGHRRRAEQHAT